MGIKWFNADAKLTYQWIDKDSTYNTANAKEILGIETHINLYWTPTYNHIEWEIVPKSGKKYQIQEPYII